ncbi:MAG: TonB family protein [bacterium]|nr:TonB family protein [bacterium]
MNQLLFERLVEKPRATGKWFLLPVSLLLHGILIAAIVVVPYVNADSQLPPVEYISVSMASTPPVPPPPVVRKSGRKNKPRQEKKIEKKSKPKISKRFVPPREIPDKIIEEDLSDLFDTGANTGDYIPGAPESDGDFSLSPFLGNEINTNTNSAAPISVVAAKLIKRVSPQYPKIAKQAHVEGTVEIEAVTDIYGRVVKARVIKGHPLLTAAALQAIRQWVYEPYILCGIPKPVIFTVQVKFKLNRRN